MKLRSPVRVEADGVEAGDAVGTALDEAGVDALGLEEGDHPGGEEGVGAERGGVGDMELGGLSFQVDSGVQGVAGEGDAAGGAVVARQGQLDHALPDACDAHGISPVLSGPTEQHAGWGAKGKSEGVRGGGRDSLAGQGLTAGS